MPESDISKIVKDKRVLNQFESRVHNEKQLDIVSRSRRDRRGSEYSLMFFHCECDDLSCGETISLSLEEYARVHAKIRHFIVIPGHVRLDIENIIASFSNYVLVAKAAL